MIDWEEMGMIPVGDAENGQKGLDYFKNNEDAPDIVLTDILMPIMDGLEMMQSVREMGYDNCVFIVLTMLEDFEYVRKALRLGALDYIPKLGITREILQETLIKAKKKLQSENERIEHIDEVLENELSLVNIMQGFLQFHLYDVREFIELIQKSGFSIEKKVFICATACACDLAEERGCEYDNLINKTLLNMLNDMLGASETGCVYVGEDNIYYFILFFYEASSEELYGLFRKVQNLVQMYFIRKFLNILTASINIYFSYLLIEYYKYNPTGICSICLTYTIFGF